MHIYTHIYKLTRTVPFTHTQCQQVVSSNSLPTIDLSLQSLRASE